MPFRLKPKIISGIVLVCSFVAFARSANPQRNASAPIRSQVKIGNHAAIYDDHGTLLPWAPWKTVIAREMQWYLNCPVEHGYPRFMWMTFMDGNYQPRLDRPDFIPATQNGMGIISYLKYYEYDQRRNPKLMDWARLMGDYLVHECNTPDSGRYPKVTRSTGIRGKFPQPADCGTQGDQPFEIQPDKCGIAGYALTELYRATRTKKYLDQALHNARVLVANMQAGDATHSPWPFRVDFRTGAGRGDVSSNMVYILRLFDALRELNYPEFATPRQQVWDWIRNYQLPNLAQDGMLWVQFFEDYQPTNNRNAWAPLNLARYLIEAKEKLDPDWQTHARALIEFVNRNFTRIQHGILICGEQDTDLKPWGGIISTYGAVLALYTATGSDEYKGLAWQALNFTLYASDTDGCPGEQALYPCRGGWQEDAHTDKIHNFVDALQAIPAWGE